MTIVVVPSLKVSAYASIDLINSKNSLGYASKVIDSPPPKTPLYIFSVPLKSGNMMVSKIYSSFFSQEKKVNTIINKATLIKANYFIKSNEWVYLIVICWLLISSNISLQSFNTNKKMKIQKIKSLKLTKLPI